MFLEQLEKAKFISSVHRIKISLYGSLGTTGRGHSSDKGVLLGLMGYQPDTIEPDSVENLIADVYRQGRLSLKGDRSIDFNQDADLIFHDSESLPMHPNGLRFIASDNNGYILKERTYYSTGGGFVTSGEAEETGSAESGKQPGAESLPLPFRSGDELLSFAELYQCSIAEVMIRNESYWRSAEETEHQLLRRWWAMRASVDRGCRSEGVLPGCLKVKRRAPTMFKSLSEKNKDQVQQDPLSVMDWVNLYALAVNEENAAGGRVVTAPTNGAAGIIPAVLCYYNDFIPGAEESGVIEFLLTAGAVGILFKNNASISGAEVGCQGEVGVACSMAAAGLCAVLGGTPKQIENAAEIGMEHHLGLTCDPVGGLVQIPCIERNAIASVQAINAARMALQGNGDHHVSLDNVIKTMRETGADMLNKYKETSRGGLAVNIVAC
jgi:L-serine dehydratase